MCKDKIGHEHPMEKLGLDLDEESLNNLEQTDPQEFIQRWITSLLHAYRCQEQQCPQPRCLQLKEALNHMNNCEQKANGTCMKCKPLTGLHAWHAKQCNDVDCRIPFCSNIKTRLEQRQTVQRIKQENTLIRRVAFMTTK